MRPQASMAKGPLTWAECPDQRALPAGRDGRICRRPLDPQARIGCLGRSEGVGRGASHLEKQSEGVAASLVESGGVGSCNWLSRGSRAEEASF